MKRNIILTLFFIFNLNLGTTKAQNSIPTAGELMNYCQKRAFRAEWLSTDADLDIRASMNVGAGSTIRYRRDSLIWINVTKMGFGVARAQVTRNDVTVINYLQNYYVQEPLSMLESVLGIPANFDHVQHVLLGNPVFLNGLDDSTAFVVSKTPENGFEMSGYPMPDLAVSYKFDSNMTLIQMNIKKISKLTEATFYYENFESPRNENEAPFPLTRRIFANSPQTGNVELTIEAESPMEIDVPKKIKFEIPRNYKRQTLRQ